MDINEIKGAIPHRYPFLLVDRILEYEDKQRIVAIKNVTANEPFFQGHFPEEPIMPGVLILEVMAQASGVLFLKDPEFAGRLAFFAGIEGAKFRKPVVPGDQLRIEMTVLKIKRNFVKMSGRALVDGKVVCQSDLFFTLVERQSNLQIHPTASVHPSAVLGKDVRVGPYSIIGEKVVIGDKTVIESHVVIEKYTRIGEECHIHFGCMIGSDAQDTKYQGEKTWVVIGDRNIFREYVNINRSSGEGTVTEIGSDNMFLINVHIGHNCIIGNNVTIVNMTHIAGHSEVEDNAVIGGMTGIHQFSRVGKGVMVGAYTRLPQDVPPFMLCEGNPAIVRGLNLIGLRRRGVSKEAIQEIKNIYKEVYRSNKNTSQALEAVDALGCTSEEALHLVRFLKADSKRGFIKNKSAVDTEE